ncbi:MAG: DUF86 domain-containing protein [Candidatus Lokiarchaeota archaeon]|nr:DUF86 domain-containing protein [Candidatus Lokiarchaeota archaeon]
MMGVDRTTVEDRLIVIIRCIGDMKRLRELPFEEYKRDSLMQAAAERVLQLAIQAVLNITSHIVAHNRWGEVQQYTDSISILQQRDILPEELAKSLIDFTRMRNLIVHQYLKINVQVIYDTLEVAIRDLERFTQIMKDLLDTN